MEFQMNPIIISQRERRPYYLIFLFAAALYLNTAGNGYALDDGAVLTQAKYGLKNVPALLSSDLFAPVYGQPLDIGIRWRPFTLLFSAAEFQFFGNSPFTGHLINIILYGLCGCALLKLLVVLLPEISLVAFITSLIFVAHPIHTEVVANIKSRDELFSFLFLILSVIFLIRFISLKYKRDLLWGCALYLLALFSKENGIAFIATVPLLIFCFTDKSWKQSILLTLPYLAITLFYLAIRASVFHGLIIGDVNKDILENQFYGIPFLQKMANVSHVLGKYLWLLIFPHPLSFEYSYNQIPLIRWADLRAIVPAVFYSGLFAFAVNHIRSNKKNVSSPSASTVKNPTIKIKLTLAFCILFYLITISIVSNAFFNIGTPMAERFLFMPSLGFCLAIAILLLLILKIKSWGEIHLLPSLYIPLGLLLVAFSFKTIERNKDWKDNITLFSHDAQISNNSAKIHYYYGGELLEACKQIPVDNPAKRTELENALNEERKAIAIYPKFYVAYHTIGLIYDELHLTDSAVYYFNKVIEMEPRYAEPYGKLGLIYGKIKNDPDQAIYYYKKGLELKPNNALWGLQLGVVYGMKGRYKDAIRIFEHVKEMDAEKINECNLNIGTSYFFLENYSEALKYFQLLLQADPQNSVVIKKIGEAYQAMGDSLKANEYFSRISR